MRRTVRRAGHLVSGAVAAAIATSSAPSTLKSASGTFTVSPGDSADIVISGLAGQPKLVRFYADESCNDTGSVTYGSNPAFPFHDATTSGKSLGVVSGIYDGTSQFTQSEGVRMVDGRREGSSWKDAVIDQGAKVGGVDNNIGARLRAVSMNPDGFRLAIDRAPVSGDGVMTVQWIALWGCNATLGFFTVPPGTYAGVGPQNVTISGLTFAPKVFIFPGWRQHLSPLPSFGTAMVGVAEGYATKTGLVRSSSVGGYSGYDGHVFSFAHTGCIAASNRADTANVPQLLASPDSFTADGIILDFESGDGGTDSYYDFPFIALDCEGYTAHVSLPTGAGTVSLTGAPTNVSWNVAFLAAVPSVEAVQQIIPANAGNSSPPFYLTETDYALRGNLNVSIGFARLNAGTISQGGLAMYDHAGYSSVGNGTVDVIVNGHELDHSSGTTGNRALHDGRGLSFSDVAIKGQQRTTYRTFSINTSAGVSSFNADGLTITATLGNGRAGKTAVLLLGTAVPDLGQNAALNGYRVLPDDSAWYADISAAPLDANAAKYLNVANPSFAAVDGSIDPNWSFIVEASPSYGGIPYVVVDTSLGQPKYPVIRHSYWDESDYGPMPIPLDCLIEGDPRSVGSYGYNDRHCLTLDRATGQIFQLFGAGGTGDYVAPNDGIKWRCSSSGIFDKISNEPRQYGKDSGDAAGACLLAGIIRYDEIVAGEITHAARFTTRRLGIYYCPPAMKTAVSGSGWSYWKFTATAGQTVFALGGNTITNTAQLRVAVNGTVLASSAYAISGGGATLTLVSGLAAGDFVSVTNWTVPAGIRLRLKSSFNISGFSATNQIILRGLKKYGMINCDTGSDLAVTGDADPRWNQTDLNALTSLRASDFEVVQSSAIYHLERSPGQSDGPPSGSAPSIVAFSTSAGLVSHGTPVTLTWSVSGATGVVITPEVGALVGASGTAVVAPQYDTVYKLVATNRWGRVSRHLYVETLP